MEKDKEINELKQRLVHFSEVIQMVLFILNKDTKFK